MLVTSLLPLSTAHGTPAIMTILTYFHLKEKASSENEPMKISRRIWNRFYNFLFPPIDTEKMREHFERAFSR